MTINRETVIRLAKEAGTSEAGLNIRAQSVFGLFERFAALVLEHGRKPLTVDEIAIAIRSENFDAQELMRFRAIEAAHGITNKESSDAE